MKYLRLAATILSASTLVAVAPQASAQTPNEPQVIDNKVLTVDSEGNPTSGVATLDIDSPSQDGTSFRKIPGFPGTKTEQVGGGSWNYGGELINGTTKRCFSHYNHPSRSHRASVSMGTLTDSKTVRPNNWAKASVMAGITAGTCNVYWDNQ